ncbi:hypothetical protein AJ79_06272 [Helicocarpus griseus UAMH5409]|uniref:Uncharacterized protein n=1 Tax=Helicocarpus griseus UAMH5409 TaxID=1447875 RepID=A0A2B7XFV0_9EURO|nr:hypothetical protein AJ79_06272 [Helicocarpus griseus UAMH5409]
MDPTEHLYIRKPRRSALIPSGVVLTPQEEALIVGRTGRSLVPPPDVLKSSWLSTESDGTKADKPVRNKLWGFEDNVKEQEEVKKWINAQRDQDQVKEPILNAQQRESHAKDDSMTSGESTASAPFDSAPVDDIVPARTPSEKPGMRHNTMPYQNRSSSMRISIPRTGENGRLPPPPTTATPFNPPQILTWSLTSKSDRTISPSNCLYNTSKTENELSPRELSGVIW